MEIGPANFGRTGLLDSLSVLAQNAVGRPTVRSGATAITPTERVRSRTEDQVDLSPAALREADVQSAERLRTAEAAGTTESADSTESESSFSTGPRGADGQPLSDEEQERVRELEERDREVRTHEQAHVAAGAPHTGAISYEMTTGPDGRRYATGGSVPIDISPVAGDPDATIAKMRQVRAAALAPAEPSAADHRAAAQASRQEAEARSEKAKQAKDELARSTEDDEDRDETGANAALESPITVDPTTGTYAVGASARFEHSGGLIHAVA